MLEELIARAFRRQKPICITLNGSRVNGEHDATLELINWLRNKCEQYRDYGYFKTVNVHFNRFSGTKDDYLKLCDYFGNVVVSIRPIPVLTRRMRELLQVVPKTNILLETNGPFDRNEKPMVIFLCFIS